MKNKTKWTDDMVFDRAKEVAISLGHFPSNQELVRAGLGNLANQIARRGGFHFWSDKVGIERVHSDSDTGWDGEEMATEILSSKGYIVEHHGIKDPYDLTVNDLVRIDVKSANYAEYGACRGWFYRVGKVISADFLMLMQLDTRDCYMIPWAIAPTTNITISRDGGIYSKYYNNFDVLSLVLDLRKKELCHY